MSIFNLDSVYASDKFFPVVRVFDIQQLNWKEKQEQQQQQQQQKKPMMKSLPFKNINLALFFFHVLLIIIKAGTDTLPREKRRRSL
jgi:hypothetical protein